MATATRPVPTYVALSTHGAGWTVLGFGPSPAVARAMAEAAISARETGLYAETLHKNLTVVSKTTAADHYHALSRSDLLFQCPAHGAYVVDAYGGDSGTCPVCERFAAGEEVLA